MDIHLFCLDILEIKIGRRISFKDIDIKLTS